MFTADYKAQPFLKEFIAFGRSIGLGMNLEAEGTPNVHIDVALDGTQWDGKGDNAGGFNLDSVRKNSYAAEQAREAAPISSRTQESPPPKEEPPKPLFDLNDPKLFEDFANEKRTSTTDMEAAEAENFFAPMFTDKGKFKNSETNRQLIRNRYGDEFTDWITSRQQEPPPAPKPQQPPAPKPQPAPPIQPPPQPQPENVVQNNKPPENVLPSPEFGADENLAGRTVSFNKDNRKTQGAAIMRVANFNRVELPAGVEQSVKRHEVGGIIAAQNFLREKGLIPAQQPQQEPQPQPPIQSQQEQPAYDEYFSFGKGRVSGFGYIKERASSYKRTSEAPEIIPTPSTKNQQQEKKRSDTTENVHASRATCSRRRP